MSEYHMSISGKINSLEEKSIDHYFKIISLEDSLVITLHSNLHDNNKILNELCDRNKLFIYNEEFISVDKCIIKATKDKHFNE